MFNDSTPPLFRGLGTTLILVATIISFFIARQETTATPRTPAAIPSAPDNQLARLTAELAELRAESQDDSLVEEVFSNPWVEWLSYLGTGLVAGSFFIEWRLKRPKKISAAPPIAVEPKQADAPPTEPVSSESTPAI